MIDAITFPLVQSLIESAPLSPLQRAVVDHFYMSDLARPSQKDLLQKMDLFLSSAEIKTALAEAMIVLKDHLAERGIHNLHHVVS